jgi:predicted phage terminase large subunit-like protein
VLLAQQRANHGEHSRRETLKARKNLKLIDTLEPWSPPADAAPHVGLLEFIREAWFRLEPSEAFIDNWHLHCFAEHAEAISTGKLDQPNLLVNTPPGTTKSLFWSVFWPAWEWTWAPWTRWLTLSYDDSLALRDAVRTRRLMKMAWYRQLLPPGREWTFEGDQDVKGNYLNNRTGWRIATSLKGAVTGNHAHRVVVDDPHNVKKAESDADREATLAIWREAIPSRVLPGGTRVMIGQRTHEEDATADWLDREGARIHHIEIRMEYEKPAPDATKAQAQPQDRSPAGAICSLSGRPHDARETEGDLLIPQRYTPATIARRKIELGPYAYSAQYQQLPTPRAGMVLDPGWILQTPHLEPSTIDLVAAFDLNYSDVETSDWTIGLLAAVERTPILPRIHLVDAFRAHLSEKRHVEHIGEWLSLWKPIMVGIEKRAYEKQGATADLCRQLLAYCEERGWSLDIEPITVDTDKVTRAMIIPGRAKAGLITADKKTAWWPILSRQMSQFPRSAHDDDVDALAHLVRLVVEKLERIRGVGTLLGQSVAMEIVESSNGRRPDWQSAAYAGLR